MPPAVFYKCWSLAFYYIDITGGDDAKPDTTAIAVVSGLAYKKLDNI